MAGVMAASPMAKQGGHVNGMYFHPQSLLRDLVGGGARLAAEQVAPSLFGREGGRIYDKAVAEERARSKEAEEQYPWTTLAGDVIGGLAVPVGGVLGAGAKLGARVLQGTKIGALFGGISGAGRGEDVSDRAVGAVIGAPLGGGLGAALGAAAPYVLKGAEAVGKAGAQAAQPIINAVRDHLHISKPQPPSNSAPPEMLKAGFYRPPRVRRDFSADYPYSAPVNAKGRLLMDIDGNPLGGDTIIVGRQTLGGPDRALRRNAIDRLAENLTGELPYEVPAWRINGAAGRTFEENGRPTGIWYASEMSPQDKVTVKIHELGHALMIFARANMTRLTQAPKVQRELRRIYDQLNNPNPDRGKYPKLAMEQFTPNDFGYLPHEWADEYFAEAARGYMMHPSWFKSIAPETAKIVRRAVREHPELGKYIRFNSLVPTMVGGAGAAAADAAALGGSRDKEDELRTGG
jgi:hypothetical protein